VLGDPVGPLVAVVADEGVAGEDRVDPHLWAAAVARRGFVLQGQPGMTQADGSVVPRSTHLTITPVTDRVVGKLVEALAGGADEVRGVAPPELVAESLPDPAELARTAREDGELDLTAVLALIEVLPREVSARMLVDFLAAFTEPRGRSEGS
jgi:hypothetical protein